MSLNLVQTASDTFQRANENPLASPPWTQNGTDALQVVSDLCEATAILGQCEIYTGTTLAANQYVGATYGAQPANSSQIYVFARNQSASTALYNGQNYSLRVYRFNSSSTATLYASNNAATIIGSASNLTVSNGDVWQLAAIGSTIYAIQNGTVLISATDTTWASGSYSALNIVDQAALTDVKLSLFSIGTAALTTYSISGNAGVANATVSYSGTATGSVTCDGSGNYTISGLANGGYTITPSLAGYTFSPTSSNQTVSGANITGVNFTATAGSAYWSQPDCRQAVQGFGPGPNSATNVNGTLTYTGQTSANSAVPPTDSRVNKPVQSSTLPQNNRTNPLGI
jgi:hypothetical protein